MPLFVLALTSLLCQQYGPGGDDNASHAAPAAIHAELGAPASSSSAHRPADLDAASASTLPSTVAPAARARSVEAATNKNGAARRPLGAVPTLTTCAEAFSRRDYAGARACYRQHEDRQQQLGQKKIAHELGDLARDMSAAQAAQESAKRETDLDNKGPNPVSRFVTQGGLELSAVSFAYTLYLGILVDLMAWDLIGSTEGGYNVDPLYSAGLTSLTLLSPVLLATAGAVGAGAASVAIDEMSAGDANLIRSSMVLSGINQFAALTLLPGFQRATNRSPATLEITGGLFVSALVLPGITMAVASQLDLPDGGVSLANSAAFWGGMLGMLTMAAVPQLGAQLGDFQFASLVGLADFFWLGTLIASPRLPEISRPETWALDLGALLGLGAGAALAFGLGAANPIIGWGTLGTGLVVGGAAGFSAAHFGPEAMRNVTLPQLPKLIAMTPIVFPVARVEQAPTLTPTPTPGLALVFAL